MKKIFLVIALCLAFSSVSLAVDTWYVTQSGAGDTDGTSLGNAWSVTQFNALTGSSYVGDTFYFSGTLTTTVAPQIYGLGGNYITLDGYAAGECDPIDATLATEQCTSSARFNDDGDTLTKSGGSDAGQAFRLTTQDYIIIQDFRSDGGQFLINGTSASTRSDHIIIKRNEIHDIDGNGINMDYLSWATIGGAEGDGNEIWNIGTGTSDADLSLSKGCEDIVISWNHLYAERPDGDSGDRGGDGILTQYVDRILVEYNSIHGHNDRYEEKGEDGIDFKRSTEDIIIRYNKFYDHFGQTGVTIQGGSRHAYIYCNFFGNNRQGISIYARNSGYQAIQNIHIFSNVIVGNMKQGIIVWSQGDPLDNVYIYNNTIAYNAFPHHSLVWGYRDASDDDYTGFFTTGGGESTLKNNIFYNNKPETGGNVHHWNENGTTARIAATDYNTYFLTGKTSYIDYNGGLRTVAQMDSLYSLETNSDDQDPGFNDPDGVDNLLYDDHYDDAGDVTLDNDLTLDGTQINDGVDLSGDIGSVTIQGVVYSPTYDIALSPATDWHTTILPSVVTINQSSHGSTDRGAYVYVEGTTPPVVSVTIADGTAHEAYDPSSASWYLNCAPACAGETISYSLTGTATYDDDYDMESPATRSTIALTGTQTRVYANMDQDSIPEPTETIILTVKNPTHILDQLGSAILDEVSDPVTDGTTAAYTLGVVVSGEVEIIDNDSVVYDYNDGLTTFSGGTAR